MGPFSGSSFLVKTIANGQSRPTTSTSIQIPFNLLSQGIQAMRQSGITVTSVTNVAGKEIENRSNNRKPENKESKKIEEKISSKKERKSSNRRGRK